MWLMQLAFCVWNVSSFGLDCSRCCCFHFAVMTRLEVVLPFTIAFCSSWFLAHNVEMAFGIVVLDAFHSVLIMILSHLGWHRFCV
ncbi:unnamed protein product [Lathyrus oleraceus]